MSIHDTGEAMSGRDFLDDLHDRTGISATRLNPRADQIASATANDLVRDSLVSVKLLQMVLDGADETAGTEEAHENIHSQKHVLDGVQRRLAELNRRMGDDT